MADRAEVAAGNAEAPFVYFDVVTAFGTNGQVAMLELAAESLIGVSGKTPRNEGIVVCHLRTSIEGLSNIRRAIDQLQGMLSAPPDTPKN